MPNPGQVHAQSARSLLLPSSFPRSYKRLQGNSRTCAHTHMTVQATVGGNRSPFSNSKSTMVVLFPTVLLLLSADLITGAPSTQQENNTTTTTCTAEEHVKSNEEFLQCQAKAQAKLRDNVLETCDFFDESINRCGDLLSKCSGESKIREIKENTARVSVRAMNVESGFDYKNCSVLNQFNISEPSADRLIDGVCSEKEFHESYKRFFECKSLSEATMQVNLQAVSGTGDKEAFDHHVCLHFENTLNNCFSMIRSCSTSRTHWIETRRAFIDSATKANEAKKLGLNLQKCKLIAEDTGEEQKKKD